jgi:hypothetical protein
VSVLDRTISTAAGPLRLRVPDAGFLRDVLRWPKAVLCLQRDEPPGWGLVFYDAAGPLAGVRVGLGYSADEATARDTLAVVRLLLPATLAAYRRCGPPAILLAAAFLREVDGHWQSGFAVFLRADGRLEPPPHPETRFDAPLGEGGTDALLTFVECAEAVWREFGLPPHSATEFDLAGFDDCGALAVDLLLVGGTIAWLREEIDGESTLVELMVGAGIDEVVDFSAIAVRAEPETGAPAAGEGGTEPESPGS